MFALGTRPFYFLHIPKSAGTSFRAFLEEHFPPQSVCTASYWYELVQLPRKQLSAFRFFRGHLYGFVDRFLPRKPRYIIMLRDPVERALSHYDQIWRQPEHYLHRRVREQQSFGNFLRDPLTSLEVTNFQTRCIGLDLDPVRELSRFSQAELRASAFEQWFATSAPAVGDHELLARAKRRVDRSTFVGLAEHFHESVARLAAIMRWNVTGEYPRLNAASDRISKESLQTEELELLRRRTALDQALYDYVAEKYHWPALAPT